MSMPLALPAPMTAVFSAATTPSVTARCRRLSLTEITRCAMRHAGHSAANSKQLAAPVAVSRRKP